MRARSLTKERSNALWLMELSQPSPQCDSALADLRSLLVRGLGYALARQSAVDDALIEDFAQETLIKIMENLDTFRGESRFTTWAQTIAVRVAFTELRRKRWQDVSLDKMTEETHFNPSELVDPGVDIEKQLWQERILKVMRRVINEELTEKQRLGLSAEFAQDVPQAEIARRLGTNRNAFYKLIHDARKKLKQGLLDAGLTPEEIMAAFDL